MLRNSFPSDAPTPTALLNEVLSLNAQESRQTSPCKGIRPFLNEVLSLNAQESKPRITRPSKSAILNEVLSLNAQECRRPCHSARDGPCLLNEVLSLNAQEYGDTAVLSQKIRPQ